MKDLKNLYVVSIKVFNPADTQNRLKGSAVLSKIKNIDFVTTLNYLKKRSEKELDSQKSFNFQYFDTDFFFQKHFNNTSEFFSENLQKIKAFEFLQTNELDLHLVQESGVFQVYNAVEGIIALGWEKWNEDEDEIDEELERLVFKFGDHLTEVEAKLLTMGIELKYTENKTKTK